MYAEAFISLSVPSLVSPYVRVELMQWTPKALQQTRFDSWDWYQKLLAFGVKDDT